jgi:hypothetical protein
VPEEVVSCRLSVVSKSCQLAVKWADLRFQTSNILPILSSLEYLSTHLGSC